MPGIGRKFPLQSAGGAEIVVLIHTTASARCSASTHDEAEAVLALSDEEAHKVGANLGGSYFEPVREDAMLQIMAGLQLRGVRVEAGSAWIGRTIRELDGSA